MVHLRPATLLKKRLQNSRFSLNLAIFLHPFYRKPPLAASIIRGCPKAKFCIVMILWTITVAVGLEFGVSIYLLCVFNNLTLTRLGVLKVNFPEGKDWGWGAI